MRVTVVMASGSPWSIQIIRRLLENGHRVAVVAVEGRRLGGEPPSTEWAEDRVSSCLEAEVQYCPLVLRCPFILGSRAVQVARALRRVVKNFGSDVLLTLYGGNFALAAWLSRIRPYAVYAVGSDVLFMRGPARILARLALHRAQAVFVNGDYLARRTRELAPEASIHPLLMGVDTELFFPVDKPSTPVRIVCTRAFKPVYDNERLIDAFRLLEGFDGDFRMTFTSSGQLLDRVRTVAETSLQPAMRGRIAFLGGVSDQTLRETVRQSHIYVSMSLSDGTSTSLLEALACGVFPVVSDIPQNREWIDPEAGNGILVPVGGAEDLAVALRRAILDPAWRDRAAGPNRARVLERASSSVNIKALSSALETLVRAS